MVPFIFNWYHLFAFFLCIEVRAAIAILGAEIDRTTPPELTQKFADVLASKPEVIQQCVHTKCEANSINFCYLCIYCMCILYLGKGGKF